MLMQFRTVISSRPMADFNPCQSCGACCAHFRVSFYWAEAEALDLPEALTETINPWMSCMKGTGQRAGGVRCVALAGEIGREVGCTIYPQRPSPCHELQPGEERCLRARAAHGLPALSGKMALT